MGRDERPALVPADIDLGPGHSLDRDYLWTVATSSNRAHRHIGTELVQASDRSLEIRVRWRPDLADGFDEQRWSSFALGAVADHLCSLAALVVVDDPAQFGATLSVRIEHLAPAWVDHDLGAVVHLADCSRSGSVLRVTGHIVQPTRQPPSVAAVHGTFVVDPAPGGERPGRP